MEDQHAIDTNGICYGQKPYGEHKRCPKRPRWNVYNDCFCERYERKHFSHNECKHEAERPNLDGFTRCELM